MVENSSIGELSHSMSLRERVESSLASAIVTGELAPGTLVSVPVLAAQFAVSATPVREAMLNLEKRGFVESVRNKGFKVTEVREKDLRDIIQLRSLLEGPAMRLVAERLKGESLDHYRDLARSIVDSAVKGDLEAYLAADSAFHSSLLAITGNERLVELVAELRRQTRLVGLVHLRSSEELIRSAGEHHELLDQLVRGEGDAAEQFLVHHIHHVLGWWAGREESADSDN